MSRIALPAVLALLSLPAAAAELEIASELLKSDNGMMIFSGQVSVIGKGLTLRANELEIEQGSKVFTAHGTPAELEMPGKQGSYRLSGTVISYDSSSKTVVLAAGGTVLGPNMSLTAGMISYQEKGIFQASGGVKLTVRETAPGGGPESSGIGGRRTVAAAAENELHATAQKINYDPSSGKIVLRGSAVVRRGEETLTGEAIVYSVAEKSFEVTSKPGGRVRALISSP